VEHEDTKHKFDPVFEDGVEHYPVFETDEEDRETIDDWVPEFPTVDAIATEFVNATFDGITQYSVEYAVALLKAWQNEFRASLLWKANEETKLYREGG